jgi:hypothetical protein
MASPNTIFNEIVATTFRNHGSDFADNVSKHNALYRKMKSGGRTRTESGGYSIVRVSNTPPTGRTNATRASTR